MAGEMSKADVTKEAFPVHFALRDCLRRMGYKDAEVRPFDVYQGPYVAAQGVGALWLGQYPNGSIYISWDYSWHTHKRNSYSWQQGVGMDYRQACKALRELLRKFKDIDGR